MSLVWLESFDSLGATVDVRPKPDNHGAKRFTGGASSEVFQRIKNGQFNGSALQTSADGCYQTVGYDTRWDSDLTLVVGARIRVGRLISLQRGGMTYFLRLNEGTSNGLGLRLRNNTLSIYRGTTEVAVANHLKLPSLGWCYIELKAYHHSTLGWAQVKVNNLTVLTVNNVNTRVGSLGYWSRVRIGSTGFPTDFEYDDMYICTGSGGTHTDFLGPIHVETIRPTADATNNFDSGNYTNINEEELDTTNYAESDGTTGHTLTCEFDNTLNFTTIYGVQVLSDLSSNVNTTYAHQAISSGNTTESDNLATASTNINTYVVQSSIFELEPGTGNAWTPATVNSAEFGIELK